VTTPTDTSPDPLRSSGLTTDAPPALSVNILVPQAWYEFDIHPATRDEAIREAVRARVQQRPELAASRTELVRSLRRIADEAWNNGVLYFGALADVDGEAPLTASLTIAVLEAEAEQDGAGGAPQGNLAALTATLKEIPQGRRPTDPWRRVRPVQLPGAGPGVRTEGIEDVELPADHRFARMAMMQTYLPFPGGDPRVAVISAATAQLALAEPMLELFAGITETFRFVRSNGDSPAQGHTAGAPASGR
jgi:hypothetical protein